MLLPALLVTRLVDVREQRQGCLNETPIGRGGVLCVQRQLHGVRCLLKQGRQVRVRERVVVAERETTSCDGGFGVSIQRLQKLEARQLVLEAV